MPCGWCVGKAIGIAATGFHCEARVSFCTRSAMVAPFSAAVAGQVATAPIDAAAKPFKTVRPGIMDLSADATLAGRRARQSNDGPARGATIDLRRGRELWTPCAPPCVISQRRNRSRLRFRRFDGEAGPLPVEML